MQYCEQPTCSWRSSDWDAALSEFAKDNPVLTALVASLTCAFHDGSPVAGQSLDRRREIAIAALRRIRSFRRRKVPIDDRSYCVRDLARGLVEIGRASCRERVGGAVARAALVRARG